MEHFSSTIKRRNKARNEFLSKLFVSLALIFTWGIGALLLLNVIIGE